MPKLSDPVAIGKKTAKNRIYFPPCVTFSFHGDGEDHFGRQHLAHYTQMAQGGAGVVFVQGTDVHGILDYTGQWTEGSRRTLAKITSVIRENGALAMIQLAWGGDLVTDLNALTTEELLVRQKELLTAALVMGELGFDGVEFHFGHCFLLCKLFDATANQRTDRFGDSLENRTSIITDIIPEIRAKNGEDFIIGVRMGAYLPSLEIGQETARLLERAGVDFLDITFSMVQPEQAPKDFPFSNMVYGGFLIKQVVDIPVVGVGGLREQAQLETLIEGEYADIAGVAHGILADPDLPKKVLEGQPIHRCADCKQCCWFTDHTKCPARSHG